MGFGIVGSAQAPPLSILPVRGQIHVIQGAGTNIVVSVGRDGVLMVVALALSAGAVGVGLSLWRGLSVG